MMLSLLGKVVQSPSQVLSLLGKVVLMGGLNRCNMSISPTMYNIFHLSFLRCPFFWVGCYMYPKKVHSSYSHEKKGLEFLKLMQLYKKMI
jgi:hypothetical protein